MNRPLLALAAALVLGCNSPATGLFVVMDVSPSFTNNTDAFSLGRVQLRVFDNNDTLRETVDFEQPTFPMSFSVKPGNPNGTYRLEFVGLARGQPIRQLFTVRRIVQMREGEVQALSVPVRGHCNVATAAPCNSQQTCSRFVGVCEPASQPTIAWREGLDAPCQPMHIRNESFGCDMLPAR